MIVSYFVQLAHRGGEKMKEGPICELSKLNKKSSTIDRNKGHQLGLSALRRAEAT